MTQISYYCEAIYQVNIEDGKRLGVRLIIILFDITVFEDAEPLSLSQIHGLLQRVDDLRIGGCVLAVLAIDRRKAFAEEVSVDAS